MITKILFCITAIIIVIASISVGITIIKQAIELNEPSGIFIGLMFVPTPILIIVGILGI